MRPDVAPARSSSSFAHAVSPLTATGAATLAELAFDLARQGDTERLAHLLDAGVSPQLRNAQGESLCDVAWSHGQDATAQWLIEQGGHPTPPARRATLRA
jgi:hypothetical protein